MSVALEAPRAAAPVAIEARGLAHRYAPGRGLEPLDFAIRGPGVVAVTGPNGAGKSTLLRILAGLLRPSSGAVTVAVDGLALDPAARRRSAGYASPDLHFYDELTALENLAFAAEARALANPAAAARAALARAGLEDRAGDRVAALSSGLRQRLRLAFALVHGPRLLLLDEPGSHLDEDGRARVARLVTETAREGLVVLATNDEREWSLAGDRIEIRGRGVGRPA